MDSDHEHNLYMHEPTYNGFDSSSSDSSSDEEYDDTVTLFGSVDNRSKQDPSQWCVCLGCENGYMKDKECLCCAEWAVIDKRVRDLPMISCIKNHPDLEVLCLNSIVLLSMWPYIMKFKKIRGPIPENLTNR